MLHWASKILSYVSPEPSSEDDFMARRLARLQELNKDAPESDKVEEKEVRGVVTSFRGGIGLVDGEICFTHEVLGGASTPALGSKVKVKAVRKGAEGGWRAVQMAEIPEDEQDWDDETENTEEGEQQPPESKVSYITRVKDGSFTLNNSLSFTLEVVSCEQYKPYRRDWVTFDEATVDDCQVVQNVKPLRTQSFEGKVRSALQDHGYLTGDIYYPIEACEEGYVPKKGDSVEGLAVESQQGQCVWRAYYIRQSTKKCASGYQLSSPSQCQSLTKLLSNKEGIQVSDDVDFGQIQVNGNRRSSIVVRNTGDAVHTLHQCSFVSHLDTQFKIGAMSISDGEPSSLPLKIPPGASVSVQLSALAKFLGHNRQMLVFDFGDFKIGRHVKAFVYDLAQSSLEPNMPFRRASRKDNALQAVTDMQEAWLVPGQKPARIRPNLQLPTRLKPYAIPDPLRHAVMESSSQTSAHDAITKLVPVLSQPLSLENYASQFGAMLHLEEIQEEIEICQFDMERVIMRSYGEFLVLEVPGLSEGRPSILIGDRVICSSPAMLASSPKYEGYIHEVHKDDILLKFHSEFHASYYGEEYNVRFTFNRTVYRRCHQAIEFAVKIGENVLFPSNLQLKPPQVTSRKRPSQSSDPSSPNVSKVTVSPGIRKCPLGQKVKGQIATFQLFNEKLNDRQRAAVTRILSGQCRPTPYILFGPPGTGKTVTLVEAILQVFCQIPSSRIVACAPSNSAADLIAERLHQSGKVSPADLVRLNAFQRVAEAIPEVLLPYCMDADDLRAVAQRRLIVSTCSSAGNLYGLALPPGHFTHVFVDEAGQATEPECLIPIGLAACHNNGQVVLAGDPYQLGPVLQSHHAKHFGLGMSLLERLILCPLYARNEVKFTGHGAYDPLLVTKLVENYRSHPALIQLPSKLFYHDELKVSCDPTIIQSFCGWDQLPAPAFPIIFHGVRGEDMREGSSPSWFNPQEVLQVVRYLQAIMSNTHHFMQWEDVGVITPYRKQVEKIRLLIDGLGMERVKVGSTEEFQGQERLVMIISTVRSTESLMDSDVVHNLGFLSNPKRFNVSITRAMALLIIIGNPHVLVHDAHWRQLLEYCVRNGGYIGADLPVLSNAYDTLVALTLPDPEGVSVDGKEAAEVEDKMANSQRAPSVNANVKPAEMDSKGEESSKRGSKPNGSDCMDRDSAGAENGSDVVPKEEVTMAGSVEAEGDSEVKMEAAAVLVCQPVENVAESKERAVSEEVERNMASDVAEMNLREVAEVVPEPKEIKTLSSEMELDLGGTSHLHSALNAAGDSAAFNVQETAEGVQHLVKILGESTETEVNLEVMPSVNSALNAAGDSAAVNSREESDMGPQPQKMVVEPAEEELAPEVINHLCNALNAAGDSPAVRPKEGAVSGLNPQGDSEQSAWQIGDQREEIRENAVNASVENICDIKLSPVVGAMGDASNSLPARVDQSKSPLAVTPTKEGADINQKAPDSGRKRRRTPVSSMFDRFLPKGELPNKTPSPQNVPTSSVSPAECKSPEKPILEAAQTPSNAEPVCVPSECLNESQKRFLESEDRLYACAKPREEASSVYGDTGLLHSDVMDSAAQLSEAPEFFEDKSCVDSPPEEENNSRLIEEMNISCDVESESHSQLTNDSESVENGCETHSLDTSTCSSLEISAFAECIDAKNNPSSLSPVDDRITSSPAAVRLAEVAPTVKDVRERSPLPPNQIHIPPSELEKKIIKQIEYYFGDFNLIQDDFMLQKISRDPDGWFPLSVLTTFKRLQELSTDFDVIVTALNKSLSGIVECSDDGLKVRRNPKRPLKRDSSEWKRDLKRRSVAVAHLPHRVNLDTILKFFEQYGTVEHLERNIPKFPGPQKRPNAPMEFIDLVVFVHDQIAQSVSRLRPFRFNQWKLYSFFRNQLTEECIEYTLAKRVLHLTPPTLKPVGSRVIQRYSHHKQVTNDAASVEAYLSKAGQMTQRGSKASSPQEWGPTAQRSPQGTLARSPANPAPVYSPSSQGSTISPPKTSQTLQKQTEWSPRSAPSSNSPQNSYQPAVSPSNSRQGNQGASCAIRESADDFEQRDSDVLVESDSDQDSTVWD